MKKNVIHVLLVNADKKFLKICLLPQYRILYYGSCVIGESRVNKYARIKR